MVSVPKRVEDRLVAGIMKVPAVALFGVLFLLAGCASDVANRYYLTERYPARDPKTVEILSRRPDRPFVVMADFQSRGESPEDIREKAAKIGADAVIIATIGGLYSRSTEWAGTDKHGDTYTHITGTAILYEKPSTK